MREIKFRAFDKLEKGVEIENLKTFSDSHVVTLNNV